jgi:hypothetical protein
MSFNAWQVVKPKLEDAMSSVKKPTQQDKSHIDTGVTSRPTNSIPVEKTPLDYQTVSYPVEAAVNSQSLDLPAFLRRRLRTSD